MRFQTSGCFLTVITLSIVLYGCASAQLNYNTLDLASTADSLVSKQVLYNFASFLQNPAALPAQVTVSTGSATTSNSITPTITAPLSTGVTTARTSSSPNFTITDVVAAKGLSVAGSDAWNQSWSLITVTDPDRMKRLQALYRYAVEWSDLGEEGVRIFVKNFPLIYKSVNYSEPLCLYGKDENGKIVPIYGPAKTQTKPPDDKDNQKNVLVCASSTSMVGSPFTRSAATRSYSIQVPDEHFLSGPTCIVCAARDHRGLTINSDIKGAWLHWLENNQPPPFNPRRAPQPGDISLGRSGRYEFFTSREKAQKFVDFEVAVLSATNLGAVSAPTGAAGAAAATPKSAALFDALTGQFLGTIQAQ
jgi:hypothetical protein